MEWSSELIDIVSSRGHCFGTVVLVRRASKNEAPFENSPELVILPGLATFSITLLGLDDAAF